MSSTPPTTPPSTPPTPETRQLFTPPPAEKSSTPLVAWAAAGAVILGIVVAVLLLTHRTSPPADVNKVLPLAPYAANLKFSKLAMSESTSLSGGKSTFVDGTVQNTGTQTVTAAQLQVLFSLFGGDPSQDPSHKPIQIEAVPLTLIRTHEPYVDTEPVSDAPIAPGETREFRLIFENISPDWDQQLPDIHPIQIATR